MTTHATKVDPSIVVDWLEVAEAIENRPRDAGVPDSPEAIAAMAELLSTVYGDALKELAQHQK